MSEKNEKCRKKTERTNERTNERKNVGKKRKMSEKNLTNERTDERNTRRRPRALKRGEQWSRASGLSLAEWVARTEGRSRERAETKDERRADKRRFSRFKARTVPADRLGARHRYPSWRTNWSFAHSSAHDCAFEDNCWEIDRDVSSCQSRGGPTCSPRNCGD